MQRDTTVPLPSFSTVVLPPVPRGRRPPTPAALDATQPTSPLLGSPFSEPIHISAPTQFRVGEAPYRKFAGLEDDPVHGFRWKRDPLDYPCRAGLPQYVRDLYTPHDNIPLPQELFDQMAARPQKTPPPMAQRRPVQIFRPSPLPIQEDADWERFVPRERQGPRSVPLKREKRLTLVLPPGETTRPASPESQSPLAPVDEPALSQHARRCIIQSLLTQVPRGTLGNDCTTVQQFSDAIERSRSRQGGPSGTVDDVIMELLLNGAQTRGTSLELPPLPPAVQRGNSLKSLINGSDEPVEGSLKALISGDYELPFGKFDGSDEDGQGTRSPSPLQLGPTRDAKATLQRWKDPGNVVDSFGLSSQTVQVDSSGTDGQRTRTPSPVQPVPVPANRGLLPWADPGKVNPFTWSSQSVAGTSAHGDGLVTRSPSPMPPPAKTSLQRWKDPGMVEPSVWFSRRVVPSLFEGNGQAAQSPSPLSPAPRHKKDIQRWMDPDSAELAAWLARKAEPHGTSGQARATEAPAQPAPKPLPANPIARWFDAGLSRLSSSRSRGSLVSVKGEGEGEGQPTRPVTPAAREEASPATPTPKRNPLLRWTTPRPIRIRSGKVSGASQEQVARKKEAVKSQWLRRKRATHPEVSSANVEGGPSGKEGDNLKRMKKGGSDGDRV